MNTRDHHLTELPDERKIMQRCAEGDRAAFTTLYTFYAPLLYKAVYPLTNKSKEESEEIIQDLFLKLWEKREKMLTIQSLRPFIFRMARNRVMDWYRKTVRTSNRDHFYSEASEESAASLADELLFDEYHTIALEAIAKLSPRRREIFNLRHEKDLSLVEIAAELNISLSAVKKQLYEATDFIKEYLRDRGDWLVILPFLFFFRH